MNVWKRKTERMLVKVTVRPSHGHGASESSGWPFRPPPRPARPGPSAARPPARRRPSEAIPQALSTSPHPAPSQFACTLAGSP